MQKSNLRFLVIGLGSMGKRRVRNLMANKQNDITGFDLLAERCKEAEEKYKIRTISSIKDIESQSFDAFIISTPPNLHGEYIRLALKHNKHFFVEVSTSLDGYVEVFKSKNDKVHAPSCTFKFFKPIKKIKKILSLGKIGKILAFQYHVGQYLPDWHPWEDYRKVYFSKKESGACKEIFPFELIWLNWLIGSEVNSACGFVEKISDLQMSADDIIAASLKYKNGTIGNIMVDVISRKPFRTLRIMCSKGVLEWDWLSWKIEIYDTNSKKTKLINIRPERKLKEYKTTTEDMYESEVFAFLDAIKGKKMFPYSFVENSRNLQTFFNIEKKKI